MRQNIIRLAFQPEKLHSCHKYFSFSVGSTIWLYSTETAKFYKSIALEGDKVIDYGFSKCESYLVILL